MRILLVSHEGYGAWFTLRLLQEGHKVDYFLIDRSYEKILEGVAPEPIFREPNFRAYDLVIFDITKHSDIAERAAGYVPVIGCSEFACELEDNRLFGIQTMEEAGIEVPPYEHFTKIDNAKRYIKAHPNRYVFKPYSRREQSTATTYVSKDPEDLLRYIDNLSEETHNAEFILQEYIDGTEISLEGWFSGDDFYLINSTLEEKKFMDNKLGPNTGCAGNLVWTYIREPRIYEHSLKKMIPLLAEANYIGMLDINLIATDNHLYGLEWTPRFGYDAAATLFAMYGGDMGEFFGSIATGGHPMTEDKINHNFAASVRVSIPPYPNEAYEYFKEDVPIRGIELDDLKDIYVYDVKYDGNDFFSAGCSGFICAPIGCGASVEECFSAVQAQIDRLRIPNIQYRTDIGKLTRDRYDSANMQGWLRA